MTTALPNLRRFAVLGDSAAFGVGDYDQNGNPRGWAYYLSKAFAEKVDYLNVSRPGAKSLEVRETQFPKIRDFKPDICAVIVGGNDILRNGFNPTQIYANLKSTIIELRRIDSEILMLELHDPTQLLKLPRTLEKVLIKRVNALNEVIHKLSLEYEITLLKTRSLPNIYSKSLWHIDRMHPGTFGHQMIAVSFKELLVANGWRFKEFEFEEPKIMSAYEKHKWMIRNGLPWFIKRSFDLLPVAIILIAAELIDELFTAIKSLLWRS